MIYEQTFDKEYIKRCLTDKLVVAMSSDDSPIDVGTLDVPVHGGVIWLKAGDYGVFLGERRNFISFEVHTILLPSARGKAVEIAKGAIKWLFENTNCLRITTHVPVYNKLAERLSKKVGMELIGVDKGSFMKDGVLHDQLIFGVSKEAICQH